ncbi:MAG TPA: acetyl-CoA carboxylase biotin carboxyl carrier protein subunit [Myxococcota bacterium]|jgi:acetyl/propionyl-CoA carboxylase alpha subunit
MQHPKMKFVATMAGAQHQIECQRDEQNPDHFHMTLDGRRYEVDARKMPSQIVHILLDHRSYDVDLERIAKKSDTLDGRVHVRVRGRVLRFEILDERRIKMKEAQGFRFDVGGVANIDSPMPGKVIKILKKEGDDVKEGEGVLVIEAMKMENELRAPKAGTVKEIRVKEGDAVESGARLAQIE